MKLFISCNFEPCPQSAVLHSPILSHSQLHSVTMQAVNNFQDVAPLPEAHRNQSREDIVVKKNKKNKRAANLSSTSTAEHNSSVEIPRLALQIILISVFSSYSLCSIYLMNRCGKDTHISFFSFFLQK